MSFNVPSARWKLRRWREYNATMRCRVLMMLYYEDTQPRTHNEAGLTEFGVS